MPPIIPLLRRVLTRPLAMLLTGCAAAASLIGAAEAAPAVRIGTAPLLSPAEAYGKYAELPDAWTNSTQATARSADIVALARALKGDPDLIYEFVRDNIEVEWTFGLSKGGTGAIIDRTGTAFDQAHLMVELLRQSGVQASYKVGSITLTGAEFQAWSGVTKAKAACQLLSSGGIPAVINNVTQADCGYDAAATVQSITLGHAWVSATIGTGTYLFDPAYKPHTFKAGIDLAQAATLSQGQVLLDATPADPGDLGADAATNVPFVRNLNGVAVTNRLNTYATKIQEAIDGALSDKAPEDLVGGQEIVRSVRPAGGWRQSTLPYPSAALLTFASAAPADLTVGNLPDKFRASLQVQIIADYPEGEAINKLLFADEIYGRRLVFDGTFHAGSGMGLMGYLKLLDENAPEIRLAETAAPYIAANGGRLILTVNMPYMAQNGQYMDAVFNRFPIQAALPTVIVHGWGRTGAGLVARFGQPVDAPLHTAAPNGCEQCTSVFGPSEGDGRRTAIAAAWLAQASRGAALNADIAKSIYTHHYSIGMVAGDVRLGSIVPSPSQPERTIITVTDNFDRLDVETGFSLTSRTADAVARRAAVHAIAATLEALEGSVHAQVSDLPDTSSTATRFEWGNKPPAGEDTVGGSSPRRFYAFDGNNAGTVTAGNALDLARVEGQSQNSLPETHFENQPQIGGSEFGVRRTALARAITSYTSEGYSVVASEEAFLGPGQRFGPLIKQGSTGTTFTHRYTRQRGGALIAKMYDANGDPTSIAHVVVNDDTGGAKGGGGGAQPNHQERYDPSKAADVLKARFVDRSSAVGVDLKAGGLTYTSPAALSVGAGEFPYRLDAQLIWRGGTVQSERYAPVSHIAPPTPWTTNWHNTLTISGSGLEAMGATDVRAMAGTAAAFLALQDVYRAAPSAQREVAGALVGAWWVRQLSGNIVTAGVGTDTRQFVRRFDKSWFAPGPGAIATLTQHLERAPFARDGCSLTQQKETSLTRGWRIPPGMWFEVRRANGDVQHFESWETEALDEGSTWCAVQQGFRLKTWSWPKGVGVTFDYAMGNNNVPRLTAVHNTLGRRIEFFEHENGGLGGFSNGLTGADRRAVTVDRSFLQLLPTQTGVYTHTDPKSQVTQFEVTRVGDTYRLLRIFAADDPNVAALAYEYDEVGRVRLARDRLGVVGTRSAHQFLVAAGLRGERVDPEQGRYSVDFDSRGRGIRFVDERGLAVLASYDGRGRVRSYTYPEGDVERFEYDDRNNTTLFEKLPKPGSAEAQANEVLRLQAHWHGYWNRIVSLVDAKNQQTIFNYRDIGAGNGAGELSSAVRPAVTGGTPTYSYTYNDRGQLETSTDPTNVVTSYVYDGNGYLRTVTVDADGVNAVTTYTNNIHGDAVETNGPRDDVWDQSRAEYDVLRRKVLEVAPDPGTGRATAAKTWYDAVGRVWKSERGFVQGTVFTPVLTTTVEFDPVGNKLKETLSGGSPLTAQNVTQYSYDGLNRVVCTAKRLHALGSPPTDACTPGADGPLGADQITKNAYLADGKLKEVLIGFGRLKRNVGGAEQDVPFVRYEYTPNGRRSAVMDGVDNRTTLVYDGFDRLIRQNFPSPTRGANAHNPLDVESYDYDPNGNRTYLRKRDGIEITFQFDALDRQAGKTVIGQAGVAVAFGYDLSGRLTSTTFQTSGEGVVLHYDSAGRLDSETSYGRLVAYDLDKAGNRTGLTWPGGQEVRYAYDAANRLTKIHEPGVASGLGVLAEYFYDDLGRPTQLVRGNGGAANYRYDAAGRLDQLTQAGASSQPVSIQTITYSPANQVATLTQASPAYVWQGRPALRELTFNGLNQDSTIAARPDGYDRNGNLTWAENRTYVYDAENRLIAATSGGVTTELQYDPTGRLHAIGPASGAKTYFLYAGDELVGEYDALATSAASLRKFVHGNGADDPIAWYEGAANAEPKWFHADRQGSVIGVSDRQGLLTTFSYGPYGEPNAWSGSRFRYTGQVALPEIQAYYYKARIYDPDMGRFLQTDPVGQEDDPNLYAYVKGDPVNNADPTGAYEEKVVVTGSRIPRDVEQASAVAVPAVVGEVAGAAIVRGLGVIGAALSLSGDTKPVTAQERQEAQEKQEHTWHITYTKRGPGGEVYSGRTSGVGRTPQDVLARRDANHHMNAKGFRAAEPDKIVNGTTPGGYQAIRGREQQLIDYNGGARMSGGYSGNLINGISPLNPMRDTYMGAANVMFGALPDNRPLK